jgi:hypothetical protein
VKRYLLITIALAAVVNLSCSSLFVALKVQSVSVAGDPEGGSPSEILEELPNDLDVGKSVREAILNSRHPKRIVRSPDATVIVHSGGVGGSGAGTAILPFTIVNSGTEPVHLDVDQVVLYGRTLLVWSKEGKVDKAYLDDGTTDLSFVPHAGKNSVVVVEPGMARTILLKDLGSYGSAVWCQLTLTWPESDYERTYQIKYKAGGESHGRWWM